MSNKLLNAARATTGNETVQSRPDYDENVGWVPIRDVVPMEDVADTSFTSDDVQVRMDEIREHGQLFPILVRRIEDGWGIIHGRVTYEAMKKLAQARILVRVVEADKRRSYRLSLISDIKNDENGPIKRGTLLLETKADMLDELEGYLSGTGRRRTGAQRPLTESEYSDLRNRWDTFPTWVQNSIKRSEMQKPPKRPTVNWEDVGITIPMTYRMINYYVGIADTADKDEVFAQRVGDGAVNTKHAIALSSIESTPARREFLREIEEEKLSGSEATRRARLRQPPPFQETVSQKSGVGQIVAVLEMLAHITLEPGDEAAAAMLEGVKNHVARLESELA